MQVSGVLSQPNPISVALYGHIWAIYAHIWSIYGPYMVHIWSIYNHIWSIYGDPPQNNFFFYTQKNFFGGFKIISFLLLNKISFEYVFHSAGSLGSSAFGLLSLFWCLWCFGLWSLVFGLWSLVFGLWSSVFGLWSRSLRLPANVFVCSIRSDPMHGHNTCNRMGCIFHGESEP